MSDLRFFEELGAELDRVAREPSGREASRGVPRVRGRFGWVVIVVVLLVLVGAAAAAVLLIRTGSPLSAPPSGALGPYAQPVPGSVRLAGLDAPDPAGGPRWDLRISRSRTGETCSAVGQVVHGQFGIVGLDGVFRRLGLGGIDACVGRGVAGPVLVGARVFVGLAQSQARTVVNGVAGAAVRSVTVFGPGGARRLRLGPDGSFITVYAGYVEAVRPRVVVVEHDGRSDTIDLAHSDTLRAADPAGGAPWDVTGGADFSPGARADEECTQVQRQGTPPEPGVSSAPTSRPGLRLFGPQTPQVCGRLGIDPVFVAMQWFVPNDSRAFWNNSPARTIVYGAVAPRVGSLTLATGAGSPESVGIDRTNGAFGVVLDGHQIPNAMVLTAQQSCNPQQDAPLIYAQDYLSDPITYAPTPNRVVITGFVPRAALRATLIGAGAPRPVALDDNGAFLAVLPGRFWNTSARISAVLAGGRIVTSPASPRPTAYQLATANKPGCLTGSRSKP